MDKWTLVSWARAWQGGAGRVPQPWRDTAEAEALQGSGNPCPLSTPVFVSAAQLLVSIH